MLHVLALARLEHGRDLAEPCGDFGRLVGGQVPQDVSDLAPKVGKCLGHVGEGDPDRETRGSLAGLVHGA